MNKKGFTLVEVIVVVAILAILAIIAIPNVVKLFNKSVEETMKITEREVLDAANLYRNDYCGRNAKSNANKLECQSARKKVDESATGNEYEVYFCVSTVVDANYVSTPRVKGQTPCSGIIVYKYNINTGGYQDGKTYLVCENDSYNTEGYAKYREQLNNCGGVINDDPSTPTPPPNPEPDPDPDPTPGTYGCSLALAGTTKTYNGTTWYVGDTTVTLTTNASEYQICDFDNECISNSKTMTISKDATKEKITAKVKQPDGSYTSCDITLNKDTQGPKMSLTFYNMSSTTEEACFDHHLNYDSKFHCINNKWFYTGDGTKLNGDLVVTGSYKKEVYGWSVAVVDNVLDSETVNKARNDDGTTGGHGFGVGLKSLKWDYYAPDGINLVPLVEGEHNFWKELHENRFNNSSSYKFYAYDTFKQSGNKKLTFEACDNLDRCTTHTFEVTIID